MDLDTDEYGSSILTPSPEPTANECWQYICDCLPLTANAVRAAMRAAKDRENHDPRPLYLRP